MERITRILIIEDDAGIVRMLDRGLAAQGYQFVSADNGDEGLRMAGDELVDLVLLDIRLPGLDGHEVLKGIREDRPSFPVLMLTTRDDVPNKVSALDGGADDYLTKPFSFEELIARIRALVRRADQPQSSLLEVGELKLDLRSRVVRRAQKIMYLSSREFALLEYLMRHPGQFVSRQQILAANWDLSFDPGLNVVDVYVRYLRRKLDRSGEPSLISTVRGTGYRLEPGSAQSSDSG